ncbi:TonB-dependent receptor plug domain-containing protein [Sphingobium boeckii]|uniref:Outer membrane receptor protein involved in Fe transport n=1 Tax=Sphingobium boeckii TaxID=1082345 RepID=A0A7W9AJY8_9SPHN|nr:TonB-dependent receptor [Sphingobium boeckii]MBB5686832.1 outer membrane receptor protein involved in Fe transport [Sphingobium boeckii]
MRYSKAMRAVLASGSALAGLMACGSGTAWAQSTPVGDTVESGEILVTGSRIVRDGFEAPTPVTVLSLDEIQNQSPSNNIADFVNQLPSLAGSTRPANSRLNLSSGQAGINALNLRNLGEIRTLVLLDGRRSVGSTITGLVDVNTIPQSLIKSVEVVTGGASAAYGSDAVAGVVNFILDKKYEGIKASADSGITTYGDGGNYSFNAALGKSFAGGRGHILLSGEIAHRDGIFEVDRAWNATGYVRIQDPAWVSGVSTTPRYLIRRQVGAANSTPGGLITGSAGGVANRLRGTYFGQGGQALQYQYGALTYPSPAGASAPTLTQGGSWQVNDSGRRIGLDPEDDRHGFFGRLSYEVSDGVELFAEASYNKQKVRFNAGPNLATGITLQADNAFLINALTPAQRAGITSVTLATTAADLPFRGVANDREVQRYVIGAEGEFQAFGKAAHWDIYGQYGRAKMHEELTNIMHTARTAAATDAVFAATGNPGGYAVGSIQCRINVDVSTTNNDPNCRPLNRLGIGVADPAAIAYILGNPYRDEIAEQIVTGANLSLTPFATWAGDVSIAIGGEYREEKISGFVPPEFQPTVTANPAGGLTTANTWSVGNYLPTNGKYNVKEAYLEAVVPLGFGLELNGAVRATDYSTSGYVTTWKAGATWQPIEDIRFRVTRSRDIRAPNLNELYQAGSSNTDAVTNPFGAGSGPNGGIYGASISYSALNLGNPDLRAEKADSWNIGGIFSPRFLPGFNLSVDYFRIDVDDAIDTLTAQDIVNRCAEGRTEYCAAITQDPNNASRILIRSQPFNFARKLVRGIDIDASYRLPLDKLFANGDGSVTLRGVATRYIENLNDTGIPGVIVVDTVGANGGQYSTPKWIFRGSASYETPSFSITAVGRGVSAGKYLANAIECQTGCPLTTTAAQFQTYDENHVKGLFYVDLNLTQKIAFGSKSEAQFFLNVTNVFNKSPLLLPETGLAANSTYSDMLGRQFRFGLRIEMR